MVASATPHNWVATLQRFVRPLPVALCERCRTELGAEHRHLVDTADRRLICVCAHCAAAADEEGRFRKVPVDTYLLRDLHLTEPEWEGFGIPIDMAFIFTSSSAGRPVALYPSPAGAIESLLSLDGWASLLAGNPVLRELQPDVEALLVNRARGAREYYRVPIDRCYALVGLIRSHWQGVSGGVELWQRIDSYFAALKAAAGATTFSRGGHG